MADRIVSAAILSILLRVLEAIRIAACERRFLIATSESRRGTERSRSTTASLRIGWDGSGCHERQNENERGNESNHDSDLRRPEPQLQTTSHGPSAHFAAGTSIDRRALSAPKGSLSSL